MSALKENLVRRYDLDSLRILATLLLIPYHTARIFNCPRFGCYFVQNEITSPTLNLFVGFIDIWFMPLFFFIAGAAAKYSLDTRNPKEYCLERFKKLFLPFTFGILFLIPPISYLGFINHHKIFIYPTINTIHLSLILAMRMLQDSQVAFHLHISGLFYIYSVFL